MAPRDRLIDLTALYPRSRGTSRRLHWLTLVAGSEVGWAAKSDGLENAKSTFGVLSGLTFLAIGTVTIGALSRLDTVSNRSLQWEKVDPPVQFEQIAILPDALLGPLATSPLATSKSFDRSKSTASPLTPTAIAPVVRKGALESAELPSAPPMLAPPDPSSVAGTAAGSSQNPPKPDMRPMPPMGLNVGTPPPATTPTAGPAALPPVAQESDSTQPPR